MRTHTVHEDERQLIGYRLFITIADGFWLGLGIAIAQVVVYGVAVIVTRCVDV